MAHKVERVSHRKIPHTIDIVEPDPSWPDTFTQLESKVRTALAPSTTSPDTAADGNNKTPLLSIAHVGSTSVPNLPAKPVIDMDVLVADPCDEASYIPQLEAAGFQFLFREPDWHEHRFLCMYEPMVNLHIFGPAAAEPHRHLAFRDRLRKSPEDRALYAQAKREASRLAKERGEGVHEYTEYKNDVIAAILERATADAAKQG